MAARIRLDTGPARATHISPRRPPRRFDGLTGVGLAMPMANVPPLPISDSSRRPPPIGSKWAIGSSVRRPRYRAVLSPRRLAIQAWENSWMGKATSRNTAPRTMSRKMASGVRMSPMRAGRYSRPRRSAFLASYSSWVSAPWSTSVFSSASVRVTEAGSAAA